MEFFEDCEKYEKTLEVKTQTSEANLGILKLSNPPMVGIDRSKIFLIDFDIWNIKSGVRMRKSLLFYERTQN